MLSIPLSRYVEILRLAQQGAIKHPELEELRWLLENWSWCDHKAFFLPLRDTMRTRQDDAVRWRHTMRGLRRLDITPAAGPYTSWWKKHLSRN